MMQEHTIKVTRTARFFSLGKASHKLKRVWFVCHGYGYLAANFTNYFTALNNEENLFIVPEGLSRFYLDGVAGRIGASWMTGEDRQNEIEDYVHYLDLVYEQTFKKIERRLVKVVAFGFSQGTSTVCRWLSLGQSRADSLVLWAGEIPQEFQQEEQLQKLKSVDLTVVYGDHDKYATSDRIEHMINFFRMHEIDYTLLPFAGGHEIDDKVLQRLAERLA